MAGIERIAADGGEIFRQSLVFPNACGRAGGGVEGESGGAVNGCDDVRIGSGYDPAKVLDAELRIRVGVKPEDDGAETEVEDSDATVAVACGEEEVGGGGLSRE